MFSLTNLGRGNTLRKAFIQYGWMHPISGCILRIRIFSAVMVVLTCGVIASPTRAAVNLVLRPVSTMVVEGSAVDVEIYAIADSSENEGINAIEIVLTWDSSVLGAPIIVPGGFNWSFGNSFLDDSGLDNLNETFKGVLVNDGDALYQATTFSPAVATPEGLLVTTLRFSTPARGRDIPIAIVSSLGTFSQTKVFKAGKVNTEITGTLGTTSVNVLCPACLFASDVRIPAGRLSNVIVSGEIVDQFTIGVTVMVELVSREGNNGAVQFTQAPPIDITQWGDPWPKGGLFSPFDTDAPGFLLSINGSVDDNGTLLESLTTYGDVLTGFPIVSSTDAFGVWDVVLTTSIGSAGWDSVETIVETTLVAGTIEIVEPDVVGGHDAFDVLEFAGLQQCFTGPVGPVDPAAYGVTLELDCGLYDFDSDGDVDGGDYETFHQLQNGPGQ